MGLGFLLIQASHSMHSVLGNREMLLRGMLFTPKVVNLDIELLVTFQNPLDLNRSID